MTLCEGMSCGTPCVATNVGDIKMLIGDTGRLCRKWARNWQKPGEILILREPEYQTLSTQRAKGL